MNRGKAFSKCSGGFKAERLASLTGDGSPHTEMKVSKEKDKTIPLIIPEYTESPKNKDPASRLRKLALKSKKVVVKGGHKSSMVNDLGTYLRSLPERTLKMIGKLQEGGTLESIMKMNEYA